MFEKLRRLLSGPPSADTEVGVPTPQEGSPSKPFDLYASLGTFDSSLLRARSPFECITLMSQIRGRCNQAIQDGQLCRELKTDIRTRTNSMVTQLCSKRFPDGCNFEVHLSRFQNMLEQARTQEEAAAMRDGVLQDFLINLFGIDVKVANVMMARDKVIVLLCNDQSGQEEMARYSFEYPQEFIAGKERIEALYQERCRQLAS